MKFKLNWGQSIAVVLFLFVIFISSFVYKTLMKPEYDHSLVSEEYYKDELNYQNEIDRLNNAATLEENIKVVKTEKGLEIQFPNNFDYSKITAKINLINNSNSDFDIKKDIELTSLVYLIPKTAIIKGRYTLKLNWEYLSNEYQYKEKIDY